MDPRSKRINGMMQWLETVVDGHLVNATSGTLEATQAMLALSNLYRLTQKSVEMKRQQRFLGEAE